MFKKNNDSNSNQTETESRDTDQLETASNVSSIEIRKSTDSSKSSIKNKKSVKRNRVLSEDSNEPDKKQKLEEETVLPSVNSSTSLSTSSTTSTLTSGELRKKMYEENKIRLIKYVGFDCCFDLVVNYDV